MTRPDADALAEFGARKVLTVGELAGMLGCSVATARRRLKAWGCLTSFNRNGRYYVLPDVPDFDEHGVWHHRDIGFSTHGNLIQTIVALIRQSRSGLTAAELGKMLGTNVNSFLSRCARREVVKRLKYGRAFVYTSPPKKWSISLAKQFNEQRERLRRERLDREKKK